LMALFGEIPGWKHALQRGDLGGEGPDSSSLVNQTVREFEETIAWGARPHQPRVFGVSVLRSPGREGGRGSRFSRLHLLTREARTEPPHSGSGPKTLCSSLLLLTRRWRGLTTREYRPRRPSLSC